MERKLDERRFGELMVEPDDLQSDAMRSTLGGEQSAVSREIMAGADLDARCARTDLIDENLRWVALHMIQETARHAGHADIIREAVDGSRGL